MVPAGTNMAPETASPQQGVEAEAETLRKGGVTYEEPGARAREGVAVQMRTGLIFRLTS